MMNPSILFLFCGPVRQPVVLAMHEDQTLETMQGLVGGFIEMVDIAPNIQVVCDEEGLLKNYPYNRQLPTGHQIHGNFLIVKGNRAGKTVSLTAKDIKTYLTMFRV